MRLSDTALKNWVMSRSGALAGSPLSLASAIGAGSSWGIFLSHPMQNRNTDETNFEIKPRTPHAQDAPFLDRIRRAR